MLINLLCIILFYGICIGAICIERGYKICIKEYRSLSSTYITVIFGILAISTLVIIYWTNKNNFIYYWDYSGYWTSTLNQKKFVYSHSFTESIKVLYDSINYDDYNVFLPTILALPLKIVGDDFSSYVICIHILFFLPTAVIWGLISVRLMKSNYKKKKVFVFTLLAAVLFPANYYATLQGYIDIAYLLPISVAIYLFINYNFSSISISIDISIAALLILAWICRRYTIYFIIGYVFAMLFKAIYELSHNRSLTMIKQIFVNFFLIGGSSLGILLVVFRPFFLRALLSNYSYMYSAYDASLATKLHTLNISFGFITVIIVICSGIVNIIYKDIVNYISMLIIVIVETGMFWMTQNMGVQHRMILNVPIFVMCCMPFLYIDNTSKSIKYFIKSVLLCLVLFICYVTNFAKALIPFCSAKGTNSIYAARYTPLIRNDIIQVNTLVNYLNSLTKDTDKHIYVLASGSILNCDILRKVNMPASFNAIPSMENTCDIDLRDGFPTAVLNTDYIVTTTPVQTHLQTGQEVISYLADHLQDSTSYIGRHFSKIYEIELDDNIKALVYEKNSEFLKEDLEKMQQYYTQLYPNEDSLFKDRIHF